MQTTFSTSLKDTDTLPEETGPSGNRIRQESPPQTEAGISIYEIILLLIRRRFFVLTVTSSVTAAALLMALLTPRLYTATTRILPPAQTRSASALLSQVGLLNAIVSTTGSSGPSTPRDQCIGILRSVSVKDAMVLRYNLMSEYKVDRLSAARQVLEDHVVIYGREKNGQIRLSVRDASPVRAAEMANGYVEEYKKFAASLARTDAAQRRRFLGAQVDEANARLARSEDDLKQLEQTTGMIQLGSQADALLASSGRLQAQIAAVEVEIQSMRTYAGPGDPNLQEAEQELRGLKAQLARLDTGRGDTNGLIPSAPAVTQTGLDYLRKLREVKYNETVQQILARQYAASQITEASAPPALEVIDMARPPDEPSSPHRIPLISGGVFLGLIVSVVLLVLREGLCAMQTDPDYGATFRELHRYARPSLPVGS